MKVCVLASGSKGNATYVSSKNVKILIDLGTTSMYTEKKLREINVDPNEIDAIIISHAHSDHINGVRVFIKKYNPIVYLSQKMYDELQTMMTLTNYEIIDNDFQIGDINISIIKTSHDANDSNGYILESDNKSIVYLTDTGYINKKNHLKLTNKNLYIFESNYDVEMLMNGKYPYYLRQRILSDKGHLSNENSSYYLSKFIGENTNKVILVHLSHENNTEEIALETLKNKLKEEKIDFNDIIVSKQDKRTDVIEV